MPPVPFQVLAPEATGEAQQLPPRPLEAIIGEAPSQLPRALTVRRGDPLDGAPAVRDRGAAVIGADVLCHLCLRGLGRDTPHPAPLPPPPAHASKSPLFFADLAASEVPLGRGQPMIVAFPQQKVLGGAPRSLSSRQLGPGTNKDLRWKPEEVPAGSKRRICCHPSSWRGSQVPLPYVHAMQVRAATLWLPFVSPGGERR